MGVCLAATKVIGTTTLGIYTGFVVSNISNYDILIDVLKTTTIDNFNEFNNKLSYKLKEHGLFLGCLGGLSSLVFQLSYFKAPLTSKHPYLIYASLVLPLSSLIYGLVARNEVYKYFKLDQITKHFKQSGFCCAGMKKCGDDGETKCESKKSKKETVTSELDNSIYNDLGDEISSNDETAGQQEDEEISKEVEIHLNKTSTENLLKKLNLANKFVGGISIIGFVIASVGIYGDF